LKPRRARSGGLKLKGGEEHVTLRQKTETGSNWALTISGTGVGQINRQKRKDVKR